MLPDRLKAGHRRVDIPPQIPQPCLSSVFWLSFSCFLIPLSLVSYILNGYWTAHYFVLQTLSVAINSVWAPFHTSAIPAQQLAVMLRMMSVCVCVCVCVAKWQYLECIPVGVCIHVFWFVWLYVYRASNPHSHFKMSLVIKFEKLMCSLL